MKNYKEGKVLGTDITHELRAGGFKGIILIRSANDDVAHVVYVGAWQLTHSNQLHSWGTS